MLHLCIPHQSEMPSIQNTQIALIGQLINALVSTANCDSCVIHTKRNAFFFIRLDYIQSQRLNQIRCKFMSIHSGRCELSNLIEAVMRKKY